MDNDTKLLEKVLLKFSYYNLAPGVCLNDIKAVLEEARASERKAMLKAGYTKLEWDAVVKYKQAGAKTERAEIVEMLKKEPDKLAYMVIIKKIKEMPLAKGEVD
jgi:putative ribosome biogenesis GTPase RsgA